MSDGNGRLERLGRFGRLNGLKRNRWPWSNAGRQCGLLDWRELRSSAEYPWDWLCDTLRGAGVANLDQELTRLRLRPLHDTLGQAIAADKIQTLATIACEREPDCTATASRRISKGTVMNFATRGQQLSSAMTTTAPIISRNQNLPVNPRDQCNH